MWRFFVVLIGLAGCGADIADYPGQSFLGAPYMASPLGECALPDNDPLIRFDAFDCTTFVETVLADGDLDCLNDIRYQDGRIGFLTRNHFIESDWLTNNTDWVENVSAKYAPTNIRRVQIDKSQWFRVVHDMDVAWDVVTVDLEYIPYKYANLVKIDKPMVVLFITDNPDFRDRIGTDLAVVHMGFWLPNGILRHASSNRGAVVDVDMAEYMTGRMKDKTNIGIALVEIK